MSKTIDAALVYSRVALLAAAVYWVTVLCLALAGVIA